VIASRNVRQALSFRSRVKARRRNATPSATRHVEQDGSADFIGRVSFSGTFVVNRIDAQSRPRAIATAMPTG